MIQQIIHQDIVDWFPQEYAHEFFVLKGVLGLSATVFLIWFMNKTWDRYESLGQQMRFITLLYFSALIAGASYEQLQEGIEVSLRHIGAIVGVFLLIATIVVSTLEAFKKDETERSNGT